MSAAFWGLFALLTAVLLLIAAGVVRGNVLLRKRPAPPKPKELQP